MPLPHRARLGHTPPVWVGTSPLFFITLCCADRDRNQLCQPDLAAAIFTATGVYQEKQRWHARLLLLMPDHLHALISFPAEENMESVLRAWKHYLAKTHGIRWQRDFFDHRIRHHESLEEKAAYIRNNPVRAGLVGTAEEWPYIWTP